GPAAGPGGRSPRLLAGVRPGPHRRAPAGDDDRGSRRLVLPVLVGVRPGRPGGPGDHGHAQRGLCAAWAGAVPLTGFRNREFPINAACRRGDTPPAGGVPAFALVLARSVPGVTKWGSLAG